MSLNFGLTTLDTDSIGNDIFAEPPDCFDTVKASLTTVVGTALSRGQILYNASLGTWSADTYDFKLTDYLSPETDADNIPYTHRPVAILHTEASVGDAKGLVITEGKFIKEKLTPDDVPAGVYGKITIVSENAI